MTRRRWVWSAAVITVVATIYFAVDPASKIWMPKCIFHHITGLDCPGCGSQRMLHALMHGDFAAAWHFNAFLLMAIPFIALLLMAEAAPRKFPGLFRTLHSPASIIIFCIAAAAWTIGRNL